MNNLITTSTVAEQIETSVSHRRSLFVWALFVVIAGTIFLIYALTSRTAGRGEFVMPLDDVYIHFQYARQIVEGKLYQYNSDLPATSGATSFLYPYLLAVGTLLGFDELSLGLWAMGMGTLTLLGSMWLVYRIAITMQSAQVVAMLIALIFALTGAVSWHFMSGMETGIMMFLTLLTFYAVIAHHVTGSIVAASLLALTRPEGGAMAVIVVGVLFLRHRPNLTRHQLPILFVPILAIGLQPVINLIVTGSPVSSGNQAKSIFATVPHDNIQNIRVIFDNLIRMWRELITGISPREGLYVAVVITIPALMGLWTLLRSKQSRLIGIMLIGWLLSVTIGLSTLETAFWHFKRYQMPLMVLLFPLAIIGATTAIKRWSYGTFAVYGLGGISLVIALVTFAQFLQHYALNVNAVYHQPLQMARWIDANTPEDAVIAVHDVGLLRYVGNRTTIDMVGLTTPRAAEAWRNGPGAVMEFLASTNPRPDYIASYGFGHGFGLDYLAATSIYGEPLTSFPVVLDDRFNVALAGDFQGVYQPDWTAIERGEETLQPSVLRSISGMDLIDVIDVANIVSESTHNYRWHNDEELPGFPTETFEQSYIDCVLEDCVIVDGGRRINGEESFTLPVTPAVFAEDLVLVTRLHPQSAGTFDVFVNDRFIATRWIPEQPGQWLEVATLIRLSQFSSFNGNDIQAHIRIVPAITSGYYQPYQHRFYQGRVAVWNWIPSLDESIPEFDTTFQDGAIGLRVRPEPIYNADSQQLEANLGWMGFDATGDYIVFVHVYDDIHAPPMAQHDRRPGNGTMPPGNWLPGGLSDTIELDLSHLEPGMYQIAVGMYDPVTSERLMPAGGDADGRFFVGEIEIE